MKNRASNGTMFSTEDFIIATFCCVDDLWSQITQGKRIRQGQRGNPRMYLLLV